MFTFDTRRYAKSKKVNAIELDGKRFSRVDRGAQNLLLEGYKPSHKAPDKAN